MAIRRRKGRARKPAARVRKEVTVAITKTDEAAKAQGLELPALAVALLLDEWRRATMEGQGGAFVRLPRERYDGAGNLWSVVRRPGEPRDKIVLVREGAHYQSRAAENEAARAESEIARKRRALDQCSSSLEQALKSGDAMKASKTRETIEALEEDLRALEVLNEAAKKAAGEATLQEWEFPLDLEGVALSVGS